MRDRLELLHRLSYLNSSIWISIDDNRVKVSVSDINSAVR